MKRLMVLSFIWGITGLTTVSASLIYVQGDVSGAWSADTVIVLSEVRVPPDSTLIIAPGVTVFFWVYCKLIVDNNATLTAVGTATDSIRFDDGWAWPISNSWHGIHFLSASSSSRLEYCHLKHGLATGLGADALGGAINCSSSNLMPYQSPEPMTTSASRFERHDPRAARGGQPGTAFRLSHHPGL